MKSQRAGTVRAEMVCVAAFALLGVIWEPNRQAAAEEPTVLASVRPLVGTDDHAALVAEDHVFVVQ